jgi:hypothetical protein
MNDPNFEFLVDDYPKCYKYCKKMDSYIFYEAYEEAAINARKAVEGIVKITDKYFNPRTYVDYSRKRGKHFMDHVNKLCCQDYCDDTIRDYILNIWNNCGNAAHPTSIEYQRSDLNNYAKQTQLILIYFYNLIENSNINSDYNIITGEEDWIIDQLMKRFKEVKKLRIYQKELKDLEKIKENEVLIDILNDDLESNALNSLPPQKYDFNLDEKIDNTKQLLRKQLELCVDFDTENLIH